MKEELSKNIELKEENTNIYDPSAPVSLPFSSYVQSLQTKDTQVAIKPLLFLYIYYALF